MSQQHRKLTWRKVSAQAKRLGDIFCERMIRDAVRDGKLPAARFGAGRNYLVSDEHIDEWLLSLIKPGGGRIRAQRVRESENAASSREATQTEQPEVR